MLGFIISSALIAPQDPPSGFSWDIKPMSYNEVRSRAWFRVPWISQLPSGYRHDGAEIVWVPNGVQADPFPPRQVAHIMLADEDGNRVHVVIAPHGNVATPSHQLFGLIADGFINFDWKGETRYAADRRQRLDVIAFSDTYPQGLLKSWIANSVR